MIACVFGDWTFDPAAHPVAAFRPDHIMPLAWRSWTVTEVSWMDPIEQTVPYVALAAHWAKAHPDQLEALVGPVEVDTFPRSNALP